MLKRKHKKLKYDLKHVLKIQEHKEKKAPKYKVILKTMYKFSSEDKRFISMTFYFKEQNTD